MVLVAPLSSCSVVLHNVYTNSFGVQVPPMEWAQRKDSIYLTIKVPDLTNERVGMTALLANTQLRISLQSWRRLT